MPVALTEVLDQHPRLGRGAADDGVDAELTKGLIRKATEVRDERARGRDPIALRSKPTLESGAFRRRARHCRAPPARYRAPRPRRTPAIRHRAGHHSHRPRRGCRPSRLPTRCCPRCRRQASRSAARSTDCSPPRPATRPTKRLATLPLARRAQRSTATFSQKS